MKEDGPTPLGTITVPEIPQAQQDFALAVSKLATEHGIDRFEMSFRPNFTEWIKQDHRIHGDMRIQFSAVDGRGRPAFGLTIELDTKLTCTLCHPPSSCS